MMALVVAIAGMMLPAYSAPRCSFGQVEGSERGGARRGEERR